MAKVLVTGGSGFIGSHLVKALAARGDEVACLVRKTSAVAELQSLGVRLIQGDITDRPSLEAAVAGQEVVYQLAGCLRASRVEQLFRVNEEGARNLAQICAEQPTPPVLVAVSSLAAAGPAVCGQPRRESDPPAPVSNYGRSKRAGERAMEQFAGKVPITIVQPAIVFGEADPAMRAVFRTVARFGIHVAPGLTPHSFSLIHADDLVNLLILAAQRGRRLKADEAGAGSPGGASRQGYYFAACEECPSFAELGPMIGRAVGRRDVLVLLTSTPVVWLVAGVGTAMSYVCGRPWCFNLDKAREATTGSWICSSRAAIEELGFSVAAPLAQRIRQTAEWYRREGWL
jgi:nucleoside-diphosphate-sugar epimerase